MIYDLTTMVWKEWRELLRQRGNWRGFLVGLFVPVLIFGIFLPLQAGQAWLRSPISLSAWFYMPTAVVVTMMADSFAGERERHTLETLLASRLPDAAILYGKILAAVIYAIFLALCTLVVGLATVNLVSIDEGIMLYEASIFWSGVVGGVLISVLGAAVGVLVSLRAATVRQAAQTLSYVMLGIFFLPIVLLELAPRWLVRDLARFVSPMMDQAPLLAAGLVLLLIAVDIILLLVARMRFRRTGLMGD